MATFHDRTLAPKFQGRLLRGGGTVPCRVLTSLDVVDEIEAAGAISVQSDPKSSALDEKCSEAGERDLLPARARALHSRRALERAADHGVALLAALGLPQLVRHDIMPVDPAAIGDALDVVIAHLDTLDAPSEDLEPYLAGYYNGMVDLDGEREAEEEHDEDDNTAEAEPDLEPSIGWPNDFAAVVDHRFDEADTDVEAVNEDGDDCGEAYAPWWDRISYQSMEMIHA